MNAAIRKRLAADLLRAIDGLELGDRCESVATSIDGGLGLAAVAAIAARVGDEAKDFEAARWARHAARTVDRVVQVCAGDATPEEIDAHARLFLAIERENARAA